MVRTADLRSVQATCTDKEIQSAYVFLGVGFISACAFFFCAFWIYHYVDLESEDEAEEMQSNVKEQAIVRQPTSRAIEGSQL